MMSAMATRVTQELTYDASLTDVGEMFPKATAQGNILVEVPSAAIEGGTWSVSANWGDPIYFAAH